MSTKYFALLTHIGAAKLANATATGGHLNITQMAVGDGNGVLPTPSPAQTRLINEQRRGALNALSVDANNSNQIIAEQVIPEADGGWWIREIGLFDADGDLVAIANCPETYKPQLQEGSGRIQTVRMILIVSSAESVTLKIDPAVVLATRGYVDDKAIEVKAHADTLMRDHITAANPHKQYAPIVSPVFTGAPKAPTPTQTANDTQLATTAFVKTVIAPKAPLASPALTGTPTAPTAAPETSTAQIATTAFVKTAITALINGSPGALDTLNELAAALGDDPNFSATVLEKLAEKLPLAGGALTGPLSSSAANPLRFINGDYGVIVRQDGRDFYLMLTDKGDQLGGWNALRPFSFNLATGEVSLGHSVNAATLTEQGKRVYSPNNKPTAADVGALTEAQAAAKYAPLANPALIGTPTAPTAATGTNTTQIATTAFVKTAITALINGSPGALDTLNELAAALGDDPNFSATVLSKLAEKLPLAGGTLTGALAVGPSLKVSGVSNLLPTAQGAWLSWNRENGGGKTDFINHRGSGSGGFVFWNGDETTQAKLAELTASGALKVEGAIYENSQRVYSPNNNPAPANIGAIAINELAGIPLPYPSATPPSGWLKCAGQAFDTALYPLLAARYTSGKLPDLRGEFIRGWDNGRGTDSGRSLLSAQGGAIQSHAHAYRDRYYIEHDTSIPASAAPNQEAIPTGYNGGYGSNGTDTDDTHFLYYDSTTSATGATETRPRNLAFNYIVRAA